MKNFAAAALIAISSGAAAAGPYDGLYRPTGEPGASWDCQTVGMEGGAIAIAEDLFSGVENQCRLTEPVGVRDLSATLYDAVCVGEGESESYRMLIAATQDGVAVLTRDGIAEFTRCQ